MKRKLCTITALALALVLALGALAGCSGGDSAAAKADWTLNDLDGHWYLEASAQLEGNAELLFGYDGYFNIDEETERWWYLHESGEFYTGGGAAEVEPDGWLILNGGEADEVVFWIMDADTLADEDGNILFIRGKEPLAPIEVEVPSGPLPGEDWRTWRSYSDEYAVGDGLTVVFSLLDNSGGFAVYSADNGERIATLIYPDGFTASWEDEFYVEDYDDDYLYDIVSILPDGTELWFLYWPNGLGSWPDDPEGCFYLYDTIAPGNNNTGDGATAEAYAGRWYASALLLTIKEGGTVIIDTVDDRYNGSFTISNGDLMLTATADSSSTIPEDTVEWHCRLEADGTLSVTPSVVGERGLLNEARTFNAYE